MTQMQDTTSAMSEAESERGRLLEGLRAEHAAARTAARDGLEQVGQRHQKAPLTIRFGYTLTWLFTNYKAKRGIFGMAWNGVKFFFVWI